MGDVIEFRQTQKMGKMPPRRVPNATVRSREYLKPAEVEAMMDAAKGTGRHGRRDAALILLAYRHALRVSELVGIRRDQVDLEQGTLHVNRLKNGTPAVHPLRGPEVRALRQLFRDYPDAPYLFISERNAPLTTSTIRKIVARAGKLAGIGFPVHPHQLRHAAGYYLASRGIDTRAIQQYLGHRNIASSVVYTDLAPGRFKDFWKD
jgi:type 1 fimbriae regulatory protein FimB/type 1 fimbriae regulatory protein FimE